MRQAGDSKVMPREGAFLFTIYGVLALVGGLCAAWVYELTGFLVMGVALALVCGIGYLWAAGSLRGVEAREDLLSPHAFPGEAVGVRLALANRKSWPLAWASLEKPGVPHLETDEAPYITRGEGGNLFCRLGWLWGHQEAAWEYQLIPRRRGLYRLGPLVLSSGDPFGFFYRRRVLPEAPALLVYLPLVEVGPVVPAWPDLLGDRPARDFLYHDPLAVVGVRDYHPGDPLRQINWVATAKLQRLQSHVLEGSAANRVLLVVGDREPPLPATWPERTAVLGFELLVAAATLAVELIARRVEVGLFTTCTLQDGSPGPTYLAPAPGVRRRHLNHLLTLLALLQPEAAGDPAAVLPRLALPSRTHLLVLAADYQEDVYHRWLPADRGRRLGYLVLDPGSPNLPPGVHCLFPGWQEDKSLAHLVLGTGYGEG